MKFNLAQFEGDSNEVDECDFQFAKHDKERTRTLESQSIEGMNMKMQLIQFGLILTLIRMSHHTKNYEQLRLKALPKTSGLPRFQS
jgi:hypothetical protein